jgi:hypothetical protein
MKSEDEPTGSATDATPKPMAGGGPGAKQTESASGGRRQSTKKEKVLIVILIVVAFVIPIWVYADHAQVSGLPSGREYSYSYRVRVTSVTRNFTLFVPIPIVDSGSVVSGVDFEDAQLGDLDVVDTANGPGLRIRSNGPFALNLRWHYDALRNSPDRISDGCALTSMTTLDEERSVICSMETGRASGTAWAWSDAPGLTVHLEFDRHWWTKRTAESLIWPESHEPSSTNNGIISLTGYGITVDGWSSMLVDLDATYAIS